MSAPLDHRLHAYRSDLADATLKGQVEAKEFVTGRPAQVAAGIVALRRYPGEGEPQDSELLFGEHLTVFEEKDGWAWVQNSRDQYVGYVRDEALTALVTEPTHWVSALRTYVYPAPDIKRPPLELLSMGSQVRAVKEEARFIQIQNGGWVFTPHLSPVDQHEEDPVEVARRFLGTPYYWGGRTSVGIDCSGLIQVALAACGFSILRDTDMQEATVGESVPLTDIRYGDIVFWPGHVAFALDDTTALHATAHTMDVTIEPLADITRRVEQESGGTGITAVKRLE